MAGASETGIRVTGLSELVRTLNRAGEDIAELKEAHKRAGDIIAAEAERRAPVRSGALRGTIRAMRQARRARVQAGRVTVPYAPPIHWGWPARNIAPNPFVSEAAQATESEWLPVYLADVQHALNRVKGA